jgi:hypothetical protein
MNANHATSIGYALCSTLVLAVSGASAQIDETLQPAPEAREVPVQVEEFLLQLPVQPGVDAEIARFQDGRLPPSYRAEFARAARRRLGTEVRDLLAQMVQDGCTPGVSVEFPGQEFSGIQDLTSLEKDFEDSMVLTRSSSCHRTDLPPEELLGIYSSRDLRMAAQSRMEDVYEEDGLTCYAVGGVPILLAPTRSCNDVTQATWPGAAAEHSQSVRSEAEGHQPVYFKESLKAALELQDGVVGLVHVTVTRSTGLGGLEKRLGRGKIEESVRRQAEVLAERLRSGG